MTNPSRRIFTFLGCLLFCQAAGALGALVTVPAIPGWYESLQKPPFNPPNWIFSPVWTLLYLMMGTVLYLLLQLPQGTPGKSRTLGLFFIQLVLNAFWSLIFFGLKNPAFAFAEVLILWALLVYMAVRLRGLSRAAFWLWLPYPAWVTFAAVLNFHLWRLNAGS